MFSPHYLCSVGPYVYPSSNDLEQMKPLKQVLVKLKTFCIQSDHSDLLLHAEIAPAQLFGQGISLLSCVGVCGLEYEISKLMGV